jgi:alkaline phosphatase
MIHRLALSLLAFACCLNPLVAEDWVRELQESSLKGDKPVAFHWGPDPAKYSSCTGHSNRMIPVYTFGTAGQGDGVDLNSYLGEHSVYRNAKKVKRLYGGRSEASVDEVADYMDQTNIFDLQLAGLNAGKKHIILIIFDGMDWQTTRAAAIWNRQCIEYSSGRGTGTHIQDYQAAGTTQFGCMVTSPFCADATIDINRQTVGNTFDGLAGGYHPQLGGAAPWLDPTEPRYLVGGPDDAPLRHAVTDSASSATSMTCGIKTYNGAINIDPQGRQTVSIAHRAQQSGYKVGVITTVPISHATPAAAYAHNVDRGDYQDISRDLLGLPSVSHPRQALPGMDVVIGAGHGVIKDKDTAQGENYVAGNMYLAEADLKGVDAAQGGNYIVAARTQDQEGKQVLADSAAKAVQDKKRLLGFFGVAGDQPSVGGHLPFASADGDFQPARGIDRKPIEYSPADITENPTLADMTAAALDVLAHGGERFWLMIEAGDVDWANHANNLDASIGAVNSGDTAFKVVTQWVERHSNWDETLVIITGDHGHYLVIDDPEQLISQQGK